MGFATKISGAEQSSVANQSVTNQIISRMTAKPQEPDINADNLAEEIFQKLSELAKQESSAVPTKNTMNNFLSALSKRGKD